MKTTTRRVGILSGAIMLFAGCGAYDPAQEASVDNGTANSGESGPAPEIASSAQAITSGWTSYTSEEYAPIVCDSGSAINQVQCKGSYCDNIRAYCQPTGGSAVYSYWTSYFSEEGGHTGSCAAGYWMTGISCTGDYCDNMSIQCTYITNINPINCYTTGRVSEEGGGLLGFGYHYFARSASCFGSNCDNKSFYVCQTGL
jgi:hypothetical protein